MAETASVGTNQQNHSGLRVRGFLSIAIEYDARQVGVIRPDQVRLLKVQEIPKPSHPVSVTAGKATSLISPCAIGFTLRYGIFIRDDHWDSRRLVVHQLAHTMQYERLGSIESFLRQYLHECITTGYLAAPMEQEAKRIERETCA